MLISCVMLTKPSRARLRAASLAALAAQAFDPPRFELIVVGDEDDAALTARTIMHQAGLKPVNVVVHKKTTWESLAAKRNTACDLAAGDWVTLWDDDDWSASNRLDAVRRVITTYPEVEIVGVRSILWHELVSTSRRTVEYVAPVPDYVVGGTLTFRRSLWAKEPFVDLPGDEGWWTLARVKVGASLRPTWFPYVAMIHGDNVVNHRAFRVNGVTEEVHDGPEYKVVKGNREAALRVMGEAALVRFEQAVAP